MPEIRCAVIVGDICTTHDADRLAKSGAPVVQVNTDEFGGDCHLAAHVIEKAVTNIDLGVIDLLIIENIGNLVWPAEFDIGEDVRVVVLSVAEGEDKPVKYPLMFRECDAVLLNKIDLLPYLDYDKAAAVEYIPAKSRKCYRSVERIDRSYQWSTVPTYSGWSSPGQNGRRRFVRVTQKNFGQIAVWTAIRFKYVNLREKQAKKTDNTSLLSLKR